MVKPKSCQKAGIKNITCYEKGAILDQSVETSRECASERLTDKRILSKSEHHGNDRDSTMDITYMQYRQEPCDQERSFLEVAYRSKG